MPKSSVSVFFIKSTYCFGMLSSSPSKFFATFLHCCVSSPAWKQPAANLLTTWSESTRSAANTIVATSNSTTPLRSMRRIMYCCISYPGRLLEYRRFRIGAGMLGTCRRPPGRLVARKLSPAHCRVKGSLIFLTYGRYGGGRQLPVLTASPFRLTIVTAITNVMRQIPP